MQARKEGCQAIGPHGLAAFNPEMKRHALLQSDDALKHPRLDTAVPKGTSADRALKQQLADALQQLGFASFRGAQEDAIIAALNGRDVFVLMPTGAGKSLCYTMPALVRDGIVLVVSPLIGGHSGCEGKSILSLNFFPPTSLLPALKKPGLLLLLLLCEQRYKSQIVVKSKPLEISVPFTAALMQDQVAGMAAKGIAAAFLSSSLKAAERQALLADLAAEKPTVRILFVTPESLATDSLMPPLERLYQRQRLLLIAVDEAHCISSWGHDFRWGGGGGGGASRKTCQY